VSSNDVADNALTGDDIDESKLGKVPTAASADAVGGLTADKAARTASIDVILPENSSTGFVGRNLEVPGFGSLFLSCPPNPSATAGQIAYTSSVDTAQTAWVDHPGASPNSAVLSRNGQLSVATAAGGTDMATFHVVKTGGASAWIVGSRRVYKNVILNQWRCEVAAQAVTTAP
jgi:hypothetical protein